MQSFLNLVSLIDVIDKKYINFLMATTTNTIARQNRSTTTITKRMDARRM